ncbi:uncharacterized protein LOC135226295 [Macrobrachium nipponense]|uniref:uncharacterized protein LOC135226295 n=1 Tax=Macrobrachium nipponense TaxID=159736 RepID=UPI0030C89417
MLVDTEAMQSVFPPSAEDHSRTPDALATLVAANGTPIHSYGTKTQTITFLGQTYTWPFVIADVRAPLLSADFLAHHGLLVDEFPDTFRPELHQVAGAAPKHGVYPHIETKGPPTHAKFCCLPPKFLQEAKNAFTEMEQMGIGKKAARPWASPLHMVRKADGAWRPCRDYCHLNLVTTPNSFSLPNMQDLTGPLHWTKIFPKVDLLKPTFRFPSILITSLRQQSYRLLGPSCSPSPPLACGMLELPSSA